MLQRYDEFLDKQIRPKTRFEILKEREDQAEQYATSGDLQGYFKSVDNIRAQEAELPQVTFAVLDQLGRALSDADSQWGEDELYAVLTNLCGTKGKPQQWTEKYRELHDGDE